MWSKILSISNFKYETIAKCKAKFSVFLELILNDVSGYDSPAQSYFTNKNFYIYKTSGMYLNLMMSMILAHFFSSAFSMRTSRRNLKGMKPVRNRRKNLTILQCCGSGSWFFTHPGSRIQVSKSTGTRIRIRNTAFLPCFSNDKIKNDNIPPPPPPNNSKKRGNYKNLAKERKNLVFYVNFAPMKAI